MLSETNALLFSDAWQAESHKPHPPDMLCLRDGKSVACVDPHNSSHCTPGASKKPAITFTFDQYISWSFNESWCKKMKDAADKMNADLILMLPSIRAPEDGPPNPNCSNGTLIRAKSEPLAGMKLLQTNHSYRSGRVNITSNRTNGTKASACSAKKKRLHIHATTMVVLKKYFKIVRTPWVVPPGLNKDIPREGGCCGAREFMKLNAMGLEDYDAVVNLDTDFSIIGSLRPLFDCAASGRFLTARGSISGVNGGMFAVKPSKSLLYDVLMDLTMSSSDDKTGWNSLGLAPGATYAQSGLQGFLYYYFYQRRRDPKHEHIVSGQVNPCDWTGAVFCDPVKACKTTPLVHKLKCTDLLWHD